MNTRTKRVSLVALMTIVILAACIFGLTHGMTQAHLVTLSVLTSIGLIFYWKI